MKVKCSAFIALAASCGAASAAMVCSSERLDPLARFWQENDGKTVRRLPIDVLPENVFWWFTTRDFSDGMKTFNALVDEGLEQSTYNCVTLSLRCNPELGDPEVKEAAEAFFAKAHASGVKVYMDTDPRIARREFFSRWPEERQGIATVVTASPTNGVVEFSHVFRDAEDHMTSGAASTYSPVSAGVAAAFAARRGQDGSLDLSAARHVEVEHGCTESKRRKQGEDGCGHVDRSSVTLNGKASGFADDEVLVAVLVADYNSIDVFSPHLIPFERELMARYKVLGADGGMRDEWGFMPDYNPDLRTYWWSKNLAAAYREKTGRDILADYPLMALGAKGDKKRSEAIRSYMKLVLDRNVEIERDFYDTDKKLFGEDVYVVKHPTWHSYVCPQEYWHNGLDWWQARRDWAQGDETTPVYVLNALAKKWGGPAWLNEGYTGTPEQNVFRVWTYAMCGGRQVYHCLYSGNRKEMEKYANMPWEERRKRLSLDLLAAENTAAQSRVRLPNLISRAPVDSPIAFVFGHENLMDWSSGGWDDHGGRQMLSLLSRGWWCDAYPASEFALGTFAVDEEGYVRVGRQRYAAVMLHNLSAEERRMFDAIAGRDGLKTRIFGGDEIDAVGEHLQKIGAVRQPFVKKRTKAGSSYPEPDGTLRLIDGTAVRIRADWEHPRGLPIDEEIESNGVKARVAAEGVAAVRCEGGEIVAMAAGGLLRVEGPGLSIALESPEDVALMKIGGKWHGVWQTADAAKPLPPELAALTPHWIRLALPNGRESIRHAATEDTLWIKDEVAVLPPYNDKAGGWYAGYIPKEIRMSELSARQTLLAETVRVVAANGRELRLGEDFRVHPECGDVGLVGEAAKDPSVNPVRLSYRVRLERLDAWYRKPDGSLGFARGAAVPSRPVVPDLPEGAKLVATRWVRGSNRMDDGRMFVNEGPFVPPPVAVPAGRAMPKTLAKLRAGEPVKVLAWGDSVTECSYLPSGKSWPERVAALLRTRFPESTIALVRVAWSGRDMKTFLAEPTGSPHNFAEKVLAEKPDLVISEFVNDAWMNAAAVEKFYGKVLADFRERGIEWVAFAPHYITPEWMGLKGTADCDDDTREYVKALRSFAVREGVGLADASSRWGHLWREGIPYTILFVNGVNHPDETGLGFYVDAFRQFLDSAGTS